MTEKARGYRPGMVDPLARLKDMDQDGIDVAILFGTQIALTVNGLMSGELATVLCRAVNEWLLEYCSADPKRLLAVGLIPCQAPGAAVQELEFLAKAGAVSAMLPTNVYGRNMGDSMFDPIYDCAQSLGMTLSVHPQTGHDGVPGVSGVMGAGSERFFKYVYVHMTAFPFELMIAMMHMIGEGVFDRFPRLRVGFMEGGAGWLPFWMERLDEHVEKLAPQMPNLRRRPSEIIRSEQIVLTCESEESGLDRVLDVAGAGTVLYASDYCHWDCNFPDSVRDICEAPDLSLDQKERILEMVRGIVQSFLDMRCPEKVHPDEWDLTALQTDILSQFGHKINIQELAELTSAQIEETIYEQLVQKYDEKEKLIGSEIMRETERFLMLHVIDGQLKDHLLSMDHLKEGIGLRGYGQKDPLVEYKKESFILFNEMMDRIEDEAVRYLFFLKITEGEGPPLPFGDEGDYEEPVEEPEEQPVAAVAKQAAQTTIDDFTRNIQRKKDKEMAALQFVGGDSGTGTGKTVVKGAKVGRNEPCPCGSGKKYKKCCGA